MLDAEDTTQLDPELELVDETVVFFSIQQALVTFESVNHDAHKSQLVRALVRLSGCFTDGVARVGEALERLGVVLEALVSDLDGPETCLGALVEDVEDVI